MLSVWQRLEVWRLSVCSMLSRRYKQRDDFTLQRQWNKLRESIMFQVWIPIFVGICLSYFVLLLLFISLLRSSTASFCEILMPFSSFYFFTQFRNKTFSVWFFNSLKWLEIERVLYFYLLSFTCLRPHQYSDVICSIWIFHHMMHIICFHN